MNQCARNMERPECMYSITPDLVMQAVQGYLARQGLGGMELAGKKENGYE